MTPEEGGLGMHFDQHHVFIIQVEGCKRWQFSTRPADDAPISAVSGARDEFISAYEADNPWVQVRLPKDTELQEVTLSPGDVLYMPPGIWHNGMTDDYSLSITTYVELLNPAQILLERLGEAMIQQADWRRHVPLPQPGEFNTLEVPASIHRFFAARLDEIRAELQTLSADDLVDGWLADVYSCDMPAPSAITNEETKPDDVLARTDAFPLRYSVVNDDSGTPQLQLYLPDNHLTLPITGQRLLDEIRRQDQFRAGDAIEWAEGDMKLEWLEVAPLLNLLIESGVLSVVRG
jgi:ribosomal protein L16 Arg81 hydroxylase